ncbi:hypothetical protein PISL3812_10003 [Talaromyces islandicus]|uniref:Integrase catalytic domain-containing protein n=1 Tax=Talaromyces islandicus TaxID=28573 RepID=A0A0U1MC67_TALIS|nr:hypothetical protein PISL3812_10003 [Talaromyces islandicus]
MPTDTNKEVKIILSDHHDWKNWIQEIKQVATQHEVWEYLNPSSKITPKNPPVKPTQPSRDPPPASEYQEAMTLKEWRTERQFLLETFKYDYRDWEQYKAGVRAVQSHIWEHLDLKNRVYINDIADAREQLIALQDVFAMTTKQERINLVEQYRQICRTPKNYDPEKWAARWRAVYNDCKEADLPDVKDERHKEDFILTTRIIAPEFYQHWNGKRIDSISGGDDLPDLKNILDKFLAYAKTSRTNPKGSRAYATFQGQPEANHQSDSRNTKDSKRTKKNPCGESHTWGFDHCKLHNPDIREPGYKEDSKARKTFDKNYESNPRLRHAFQMWKQCREKKEKSGSSHRESKSDSHANATRTADNHEESEYDFEPEDESDVEEISRPNIGMAVRKQRQLVASAHNSHKHDQILDEEIRNNFIYDTGADVHVCNDQSRFIDFKPCTAQVEVGNTVNTIMGIGNVIIYPSNPLCKEARKGIMLHNVRYVPGFHTNLISASSGRRLGVYYDMKKSILYKDDTPICQLKISGLFFVTWSKRMISVWASRLKLSTVKTTLKNSDDMWHRRLGHANDEIVNHLEAATTGAVVKRTIRQEGEKCVGCALSKAPKQISRVPRERGKRPFENIHVDLIPNLMGYNYHNWVLHAYCDYSHFKIIITTRSKSVQYELIWIIKFIQKEFGVHVVRVYCDGEQALGDNWLEFCKKEVIQFFQTPPDTPEQNPHAERSGGVITVRSRALIVDAQLPHGLWPEAYRAAVYILNRTPVKQLNWKTPYEIAYSESKSRKQMCRPYIGNLYKFGSRAYVKLHKIPQLHKVLPRVQIGYLVGYEAHNIWRIWIPTKNTVIRARDVQFDETKGYNPEDPFTGINISLTMPQQVITTDLPKFGNLDSVNVDNTVFDSIDDNGNLMGTTETRTRTENQDNQALAQENQHIEAAPSSQNLNNPTPIPTQESEEIPDSRSAREITPISHTNEVQAPEAHLSLTKLSQTFSDRLPNKVIQQAESQELATPPRSPHRLPHFHENHQTQRNPSTPLQNQELETQNAPISQHVRQESTAPRDINLELSESNIIEGTRTRHASRRLREAEEENQSLQERRDNKRKRRAHLVKTTLTTEAIMVKAFMASTTFQNKLHRSQLPKEPDSWRELKNHPLKDGFYKAAHAEFIEIQKRGTWNEVSIPDQNHHQVLPVRWVFTYKFDNDDYLTRYKARLCVRGDLQRMTMEDTRAATLAAQTFRTMMALATAFDLEIWQCDAINAFLNSFLDEIVYIHFPDGFKVPGKCLKLIRALYGLKRAPRLWQKELSRQIKKYGFEPVNEDECLFVTNGMILMFFVDDIIVVYNRQYKQQFDKFRKQFIKTYEVREMQEFKWFLGIRIIRDREHHKLWLIQDAYIDKLATIYGLKSHRLVKTPISKRYGPNTGQATAREIHNFQRRIGSLQYAAVTTRADVAFAASHLSQFLKNPSQEHITAADHAIAYLYQTRDRAIQYTAPEPSVKNEVFIAASDAAYADNHDRRSSQGSVYKLYGGIVEWHATKQKTITTSTTEAELLSLSDVGKQIQVWNRLFKSISFKLDHEIRIQCDNKQTVGLMDKKEPPYHSKLRHVDIMNHWLRQEVQDGRISVQWVPTGEMPADGLTKPLPRQKHQEFVQHLGLIEIGHLLGV